MGPVTFHGKFDESPVGLPMRGDKFQGTSHRMSHGILYASHGINEHPIGSLTGSRGNCYWYHARHPIESLIDVKAHAMPNGEHDGKLDASWQVPRDILCEVRGVPQSMPWKAPSEMTRPA